VKKFQLTGLVAATHTPFGSDGSLRLGLVQKQAEHFLKSDIRSVFIGGTTGECHSLTFRERQQLTERWLEVIQGTQLQVVVHVGGNCLSDAKALAAHAQQLGATAVAAMAPSYFKPSRLETLLDFCAEIAASAPELPFYYYHIPILTGVSFGMADFLQGARERMPNLAGLKFTDSDFMQLQQCLQLGDGAFDVLSGFDEMLLAALSLGVQGAVGSTYNFAAPIYHRMMKAWAAGDIKAARSEQFRSVQLVHALQRCGSMGAGKAVMRMVGVDVGPARLPISNPSPEQFTSLQAELNKLGFFDWIQRSL
jgi:N-acetylneuraminate lyase